MSKGTRAFTLRMARRFGLILIGSLLLLPANPLCAETAQEALERGREYESQQDFPQAFFWYMKAAEQGLAAAEHRVGLAYQYGNGITKNYTRAFEWYKKAADHGYPDAQYKVGFAYESGQGVMQDYSEARRWYLKASLNGNSAARQRTATLDRELEESALQGSRNASSQSSYVQDDDPNLQYRLGLAYRTGRGVPQDFQQAFYWYKKAADQGDAGAEYEVGYAYDHGHGVPQDKEQARLWYRKAADQGNANAREALIALERQEQERRGREETNAYAGWGRPVEHPRSEKALSIINGIAQAAGLAPSNSSGPDAITQASNQAVANLDAIAQQQAEIRRQQQEEQLRQQRIQREQQEAAQPRERERQQRDRQERERQEQAQVQQQQATSASSVNSTVMTGVTGSGNRGGMPPQCAEVTQFVSLKLSTPTGAGNCEGEVVGWLTNRYSAAVDCTFYLGGTIGAQELSIPAGQTRGGELGGVWNCHGSTANSRYRCYPKAQNDEYLCNAKADTISPLAPRR